jgi:ribokinase
MIFVLGNVCRDTTFYVDRMPVAGETINAAQTQVGLGGKGLNQAIAAHRCGARIKLIAGVGEDWSAGDEAVAVDGAGPDLEFAVVRKPGPTDCSSIVVAETGENLIVTSASQAEALSIADVAPFLEFQTGDVLVLQCNLQPDLTRHAIDGAKRAGTRIIFNPAPYKNWARSLESLVDVIIMNEQEVRSWTSKNEPSHAIHDLEAPLAIVTLGKEGCLAKRRCEPVMHLAAPAADVTDTTGAGDTFVGVFAAEWLATRNQEKALRLALVAASASVAKQGAIASIPARREIDQLRVSLI